MFGIEHLVDALTPFRLTLSLVGVICGTALGAIPGLTATMAIAVLVPLTFSMDPASALVLMGAIYTGAIYGGAYSAILLNTPGTPSAIATTFDGFPMAKRGDGDLAITLACLASVFGGLVGALALLLLAPPLAKVALAFGPVEYFWLAVFGLTLISAIAEGALAKGMIGAGFGLLLSCVGVAQISAATRFTFGFNTMLGGVNAVSGLIGLYCVPVLMDLVARPERHLDFADETRGFRLGEAFRLCWNGKFNLIRSSIIGTIVGILPGAGGSIAGLVSYSEARRASRHPERFGKGEPAGVQATESANNATVGGGMIPTLVLGIPGTPPDAVILGALLVQGIRTGPGLFTSSGGAIVYTFIYGLFIATLLMLPTGLMIGRYAFKSIVSFPKALLVPIVAFMTIIGSFAIRNSVYDVVIMIVLGVIGWVFDRLGFKPSPIVLGLILGPIAEQGFVQGWMIGQATDTPVGIFFNSPLPITIVVLILFSLAYPLIMGRYRRRKSLAGQPAAAATAPAPRSHDLRGTIGALVFIAISVVAWLDTTHIESAEAYVFPRTVIVVMVVFSALLILRNAFGRGGIEERPLPGSMPRRLGLVIAMLLAAFLMPYLGFIASGILAYMAIMAVAMYEPWTNMRKVLYPIIGLAIVYGFYFLFDILFKVPLPAARWF
jgi:putative tricarboxylic transport membrane protein